MPKRIALLAVVLCSPVLLFEFFPLFVALVGVVAAVLLYMKDRSAREHNEADDPVMPRDPSRKDDDSGPGLRPSMRP